MNGGTVSRNKEQTSGSQKVVYLNGVKEVKLASRLSLDDYTT